MLSVTYRNVVITLCNRMLLVMLLLVARPMHALFITSMDDVWMFEVACRTSRVNFYTANGALLARANEGRLMSASGSVEGEIRQCEKIINRDGRLLARRDSNGRYYLADGSILGRIEQDRIYARDGRLVLRIDQSAVYDASGRLQARFIKNAM